MMKIAGYRVLALVLMAYAVQCASVAAARLPHEFECIIKPSMEVNVASQTTGVLDEVLVDRGDTVRKGDLIAKLDSTVEKAEADLLKARANNDAEIESGKARYRYQSAKFKRMQELYQKHVNSIDQVQLAQAEAELAKADIRKAEVNQEVAKLDYERARRVMARRLILSPMSGMVVERRLNPGEFVHEQVYIVKIIQVDPLYVEAYLPISVYGTVKQGMTLTVRPEKPIGGSFPAKVIVVDRMIDAASGTFGVRLSISNEDGSIPSGIRCHLQ